MNGTIEKIIFLRRDKKTLHSVMSTEKIFSPKK
jgi:hypothetical protein